MNAYMIGPSSPFDVVLLVVVAVVVIAAWVILAGSRFVQGGIVERPERVPQLYGYTACLIGLMMSVVSILSLAEAAVSLSSPLYNTGQAWASWGEPSVTSFEAFRATYQGARELRTDPTAPKPEPLSEPELQRRYEALRDDHLAQTRARGRHAIVTSLLSLLIGIGLFGFHWRWVRHRAAPSVNATSA